MHFPNLPAALRLHRTRLLILSALLLLAVLVIFISRSHTTFSGGYYKSPLDIPLQLAANFGELREDHFHMGTDIRTTGREGLPVHAAADGYISHLSIQEYGLGKALFVTHPNGQTTVYAHLSRFTDELEKMAHSRQYASESWPQEIDLPPGKYQVQKGQMIASSGNTGNSAAPHLHFEIRETRTGKNLNPLLNGFSIPDDIPPAIKGLYLYDRRFSTYAVRPRKLAITGSDGNYHTAASLISVNSPLISLGICVSDKSGNSPHLSGIYQARMWLDGRQIFAFRLDGIPDSDTRYINACIDYAKWTRLGIYVQHLSILPGNHAPLFAGSATDGRIQLKDTAPHKVRIEVCDVYGNSSVLQLQLKLDTGRDNDRHIEAIASYASGAMPSTMKPVTTEIAAPAAAGSGSTLLLQPDQENRVAGRSVRVIFPSNTFYDEVPFRLSEQPDLRTGSASPLIAIHDPSVPVHNRYLVRIKTTLRPNDPFRKRTVMILISGDSQWVIHGKWTGDWMEGSFRRLGRVQLVTDTTAPVILPSGWGETRELPAGGTGLTLLCRDNLGAIASFRAEIDHHWVVFAAKADSYSYTFDEYCPPGRHLLTVTVKDAAGNETRRSFAFTRR